MPTTSPPFPSAHWEHYPHEADIGVRGFGATLEQAFEQVALALTAIIADPGTIRPRQRVGVLCTAPDAELLLVDWLNAIIYEMATRRMLFSRYEVQLRNTQLSGTAWGEPVDATRHQPVVEPKGATYTSLVVRCEENGWVAQCVVDV